MGGGGVNWALPCRHPFSDFGLIPRFQVMLVEQDGPIRKMMAESVNQVRDLEL